MNHLIPHSIILNAEKAPDRTAFRCGDVEITYAELLEQMSQVAYTLSANGIDKGDRVGIYLKRSLECALAIYGILSAGAVYVPLDPAAPTSRIAFQINDCDISCIITGEKEKQALDLLFNQEQIDCKLIIGLSAFRDILTVDWTEVRKAPARITRLREVLDEDLAYLLYTSGSTGTPKAIMHTHRSGLSYAKLATALYQITSDDVLANHSPIFFDISTLGFLAGPFAGANTIIIPEAYIRMPASMAEMVKREKVTIWYSVPLALRQLIPHWEHTPPQFLRWILYAGEPFPIKPLRALLASVPWARFSNVYGPTELNQCTYFNFDHTTTLENDVPLGRVSSNTQALILDEEDMEVAKGIPGELVVRSCTMMAGYWKNRKMTEASFYRVVLDSDITKTYYRTGDLVREDTQGRLRFLGRRDRQVKIRGYRFELDDISNNLLTHPSIEDVAVYALEVDEEKSVAISVVVRDRMTMTERDVVQHLKTLIPTYVMPQKIEFINQLPRTATGKLNYQQLKDRHEENKYDAAKIN